MYFVKCSVFFEMKNVAVNGIYATCISLRILHPSINVYFSSTKKHFNRKNHLSSTISARQNNIPLTKKYVEIRPRVSGFQFARKIKFVN